MEKSLFLALFFIATGCAQNQIIIKSVEAKLLPSYENANPPTKVKGSLNIIEISDQRTDKTTIGMGHTGVLAKETPIYLDVPADQFFKDHFTSQIAKRGVETANSAPFAFRGVLKNLWIFEKAPLLGFESSHCNIDITFEIVATKNKQVVYRGTLSSQGSGLELMFDVTYMNGPTLEACISVMAEQLLKNHDMSNFGIKSI